MRIVRCVVGVLAFGCTQPPEAQEPAQPPAETVQEARVSSEVADASDGSDAMDATVGTDTPDAGRENTAGSDGGAAACPSGMQLVEGEYCTKVEQKCLKSWYDKSNKKTVCEEFEPKSRCVGERVKKRFCMDKYAWPNQKGERPEVMNRFHQAQVKCASAGKRLCTETEWTFACEGPQMKPFPYGYVRDTNKCHGDVDWDSPDMKKVARRDPAELARLWKGVRAGSQPQCVSDFGVHDLPGNTDEVVSNETTGGWRGKFDSVHTGGPWYRGVRNQCRPKIYTHDEGFYYYFLSFRCCAEPDGQTTDPRTPRQRREDWKFSRVERIAGFTVDEVREKLKQKAKTGDCGCGAKDISCKTLCGTLLGPEAKDYVREQSAK
ncbi:MAG TPA: SUMF1/EgtB/PvdO family nonheme iron enzyme [Polyangiaceae bacterium]|nr:SUMF1/EgtB/PvdO family nonheme iron enzyme [Polyangiaceae bacterium]